MNSKSKYKYLSEIISIGKGKRPKHYYSSPHMSSIPYILIENFDGKYTQYVDKEDMTICNPNDILIVWDGARAGLSSFGHKGAIGSTIAKLYIKHPSEILPKFVYFFIQGKYEVLNRNTHGAAVPHLTKNYLENLNVPILSKKIQELMVSSLETCESAIQKRKEANRLTAEFLKSTFLEMFGDPLRNPKRWTLHKIGDLLVETENGDPGNSPEKRFDYIDISSIDNITKVILQVRKISGKKAPSRARQLVKAGDILVSTVRPNLNAVAIVLDHLINPIASTGFCVLRVNENKTVTQYLFEITKSPYFVTSLVRVAKGASYPAVTDSDIKDLAIPVPPLREQQKFANLVQKVEKLKQKQRESEKELTNLFNSLMQRAFRGELCRMT